MTNYPTWTASYSNESFDRITVLAAELTEADRKEGRPAPEHGCSREAWERASAIVKAARS